MKVSKTFLMDSLKAGERLSGEILTDPTGLRKGDSVPGLMWRICPDCQQPVFGKGQTVIRMYDGRNISSGRSRSDFYKGGGRCISCARVESIRVRRSHPKTWTNSQGYLVRQPPRSEGPRSLILQHREVWEAHNRPLRDGENIHHKNGLRADNRIENLELWTVPQPYGQRADDLAKWLLDTYSCDELAQMAQAS